MCWGRLSLGFLNPKWFRPSQVTGMFRQPFEPHPPLQSTLSRFGATKIAKFTSITEPLEIVFQNVSTSVPYLHSVDLSITLSSNAQFSSPLSNNNVYTLFPFCTHSTAVDFLKQNPQLPGDIDQSDYDYDTPKQPIVPLRTLTTRATTSYVLNAFETYNTPYGELFKKITDGYGYVAVTFLASLHDLLFLWLFSWIRWWSEDIQEMEKAASKKNGGTAATLLTSHMTRLYWHFNDLDSEILD